MVTKAQIAAGVSDYILNDVIQAVTDTPLKIAIGALAYSIRNNPQTLDTLLENSMVKALAGASEGGLYDMDKFMQAVKASMQSYGNLTVTIPAVPFISKQEKTLSFSADDVERLRSRIEGSNQ